MKYLALIIFFCVALSACSNKNEIEVYVSTDSECQKKEPTWKFSLLVDLKKNSILFQEFDLRESKYYPPKLLKSCTIINYDNWSCGGQEDIVGELLFVSGKDMMKQGRYFSESPQSTLSKNSITVNHCIYQKTLFG
jgi:hypothetical protein